MTLLDRGIGKAVRVARRLLGRRSAIAAPVAPGAAIDFDAWSVAADPFPAYDLLRTSSPVHFLPRHGVWLILGYDEVRTAFSMTQQLSNQPYEDVDAVLLAADPPDHAAVRRVTSRYFTRVTIDAISRSVAEAAPQLLKRRTLDAVREFAEPLSELAAARLVGFDDAAVRDIRAAGQQFDDFSRFIDELRAIADRATIYARLRDDDFNEVQARSLVALFWVASTKTTERVIAAATLRLVLHEPVRRELQRNPGARSRFIEEVLRLHSPEPMLRRRATAPLEVGGKTIPAESLVCLGLAAANRDPAQYEDPHEFRLDRPARGHLSFGHGIHHCIGATLALAVVDAAVRELIPEGRNLRLAQQANSVTWQASMMVRYIDHLFIEADLSEAEA